MSTPLALPTSPDAARVFFGFRSAALSATSADTEQQRAQKRTEFFARLGRTFMPATPLMMAPLGLAAYLPAILDPPTDSSLPDEAALIVYVSREVYRGSRETSLSRRLYTSAHEAVFDMKRSYAEFPTLIEHPTSTPAGTQFAYLMDRRVDWQDGEVRFLLIAADREHDLRTSLLSQLRSSTQALIAQGCDQLIVGCAANYAGLWLHCADASVNIDLRDIVPSAGQVLHNLPCTPSWVYGDGTHGETPSGASAYNFRFSRELKYFVEGTAHART
jgi:hypothetical protein